MGNNKRENNDKNKVSRNTSYYKSKVSMSSKPKKSTSDFMDMSKKRQMTSYKLAMLILFALMIAFTGLILLGTWLNSLVGSDVETEVTGDLENPQFTTQYNPDAQLNSTTSEIPVTTQTIDISETFHKYNGVYLDVQKLEGLESLQNFIDNIKAKGINAVNIDIKTDGGEIPYHVNGNTDSVMMGANQINISIEEIINLLHENELYVSGTIACFKDSLASTTWVSYSLHSSSEISTKWQDSGGNLWLNPYSEDARKYISSIVADSARLGFDEIILSWFFFPDVADSKVVYGDYEASKYSIVKDFVTEQRYALDNIAPKVKLGLNIPLNYFLNVPNETMGLNPNDLTSMCNFLTTSFAPADVPSGATVNGAAISNPENNPLDTVKSLCGHFEDLINNSNVNFRPSLQAFNGYGEQQILNQKQALYESNVDIWQLVNYDNNY